MSQILPLETGSHVPNVLMTDRHYVPLPKNEEAQIWEAQKARRLDDPEAYLVADDERVEDAVLTDEDIQPTPSANSNRSVLAVA